MGLKVCKKCLNFVFARSNGLVQHVFTFVTVISKCLFSWTRTDPNGDLGAAMSPDCTLTWPAISGAGPPLLSIPWVRVFAKRAVILDQ